MPRSRRAKPTETKPVVSDIMDSFIWTCPLCTQLDATGNWRNFREDDDGSGWDLDQQRIANKVNEITDIAETLGISWVTPVYSKAGNMTRFPKPADPTAAFYATYDAWNRLVKIEEDDGMSGKWNVAECEYDGAKRRSIKTVYASGTLDEIRHFFYTEPRKWQVVEERVDISSDPKRQFVWGRRHVDDLVERDRDTTDDTALDERLYGMEDANNNFTAIASATGVVVERFSYSAFGCVSTLNATFSFRTKSSFDWEFRFAGYRFDDETELLFVRNRAYNSAAGAWLQRDRLGYLDGLNLYAYVRNDPIINRDPFGDLTPGVLAAIVVAFSCLTGGIGLSLAEMVRIWREIKAGIPVTLPVGVGRVACSFAAGCGIGAALAAALTFIAAGGPFAIGRVLVMILWMALYAAFICTVCVTIGCAPSWCAFVTALINTITGGGTFPVGPQSIEELIEEMIEELKDGVPPFGTPPLIPM